MFAQNIQISVLPSNIYRCQIAASSCVDVTNDCEVKTHLCDRPEYQTMVNTYCQKTCNRCSVQKTTPSPPGKLQKTQVSVSSFCTLTRSGGARACEYTRSFYRAIVALKTGIINNDFSHFTRSRDVSKRMRE